MHSSVAVTGLYSTQPQPIPETSLEKAWRLTFRYLSVGPSNALDMKESALWWALRAHAPAEQRQQNWMAADVHVGGVKLRQARCSCNARRWCAPDPSALETNAGAFAQVPRHEEGRTARLPGLRRHDPHGNKASKRRRRLQKGAPWRSGTARTDDPRMSCFIAIDGCAVRSKVI